MSRLAIALTAALVFGCGGSGGGEGKAKADKSGDGGEKQAPVVKADPSVKTDPAAKGTTAPSPKPMEYTEVTHDGRLYVVGSKATADKVAKGQHPQMTVTRIGAGPKGETVVFESNKEGVEKQLQAEYDKRHPKK